MTQNAPLTQSLTDLLEDLENLKSIALGYLEKLNKISDPNQKEIKTQLKLQIEKIIHDSEFFKNKIKTFNSQTDIWKIINIYHNNLENLHQCAGLIGAFYISSNWQSPSFIASTYNQNGIYNGKIRQSYNDYTRDQNFEGNQYAQFFQKEYIEHFPLLLVKTYLVNSGMAALTTILQFLTGQHKIKDRILIGKGSYFENKIAIKNFFPNASEFDETKIESLPSIISQLQPKIIFFDSSGNNPDITLPDSEELINIIQKESKSEVFIVIDNTAKSIFLQPFKSKQIINSKVNILCFESLNKYHQYGLDRVTGGIIYSAAKNDISLYDYRDHAGTNISDYQAITLPLPNKSVLKSRLLRHQKNAITISMVLQSILANSKESVIESVVYPGLNKNINNKSFFGSLITLKFKPKYQSINNYNKTLLKIINNAKSKKIPLIGGTSFGFTTTRLYIPASRPNQGTPFFRIAVGTETTIELEEIIKIFTESLRS